MQSVTPKFDTSLHRAFCLESPYATVIADRDGAIVEWNRAAVRLTGIPRTDAIAHSVWELFGRIAPARIPYETAVEAGRNTFLELAEVAFHQDPAVDSADSVQRRVGMVLSTIGHMYRLTVDFFPIWVDDTPAIVAFVVSAEPA